MATPLVASTRSISVRIQGNLGEFMTFCIGSDLGFPRNFRPFAANALAPLVDVSRADIDILWLRLAKTAANDVLVVHEVTTTTDPSLGLLGDWSTTMRGRAWDAINSTRRLGGGH